MSKKLNKLNHEKKKNILLVYTNFSTFVKKDFDILSAKYTVDKYCFIPSNQGFKLLMSFLKQLIFLLFKGYKYEVFFMRFGSYHTLFPVLFAKFLKKKSYIVVGGYDVNTIPEFQYGSFYNSKRAFFARNSFKNATLCLPVVDSLEKKLKEHVPEAKSKIIYNGFGIIEFNDETKLLQKENTVITVSITKDKRTVFIKGLDRFMDLAKSNPTYKFILIGVENEAKDIFDEIPENVQLIPKQSSENLKQLYRDARFYVQLSRSEGMPNALCEAMMWKCIPLGTNVGGIETIIDNCGYYGEWNVNNFTDYINKNSNNAVLGQLARKRIIDNFSIEKRKKELEKTIES